MGQAQHGKASPCACLASVSVFDTYSFLFAVGIYVLHVVLFSERASLAGRLEPPLHLSHSLVQLQALLSLLWRGIHSSLRCQLTGHVARLEPSGACHAVGQPC